MGTKLGNLHIRNATVEEVAPLLPGAIVGQWFEGFVSAYSEEYQWGSAEQAGRKLSRKLPAATVLTAAIFDSDVVSFEVYRAGKRLTAHLLNPYEDVNRPGNPKVFCEALGLPPEDEKRLRTLWKKGDAEEQLELTGSLLGLPLYHDPAYMPKEPVRRDTETVDAWIAERPDPPKIKSVTKVELIQELPQMIMSSMAFAISDDAYYILTPTDQEGYSLSLAGQLWRLDPDKGLVCIAPQEGFDFADTYCIQGERIVVLQQLRSEMGMAVGSRIGYDSQSILPWQMPLECEGQAVIANDPRVIRLLPDGGFWGEFSIDCDYGPLLQVAARFGSDGHPRWSRMLPRGTSIVAVNSDRLYVSDSDDEGRKGLSWFDLEGQQSPITEVAGNTQFCAWGEGLYLSSTDYRAEKITLFHLGADLDLLGQIDLPGCNIWSVTFSPKGDTLFLSSYTQGLWLLDAKDLSVHQALLSKDKYMNVYADGMGRYWACSGNSTLIGYDGTLRPISRHRMKGTICGVLPTQVGLTVLTYDRAEYDYQYLDGNLIATPKDPKRPYSTLRVYRIS